MSELIEQPSAEEIARHYSALLDSVNLLNAGQQEGQSDEDWADTKARNIAHCELMLAKDYWTDENLDVVRDSIK